MQAPNGDAAQPMHRAAINIFPILGEPCDNLTPHGSIRHSFCRSTLLACEVRSGAELIFVDYQYLGSR